MKMSNFCERCGKENCKDFHHVPNEGLDLKPICFEERKMSRFRKFLCNTIEWHSPENVVTISGINIISRCKYCGADIMRDCQGNWFGRKRYE